MKTTIVYHDHCHDGITALWCALQAIPDGVPYPATYSKAVDVEAFRGGRVVFVDFCWPLDVMNAIREVAESVLVIDHHKSALDMMDAAGTGVVMLRGQPTWQGHIESAQQDSWENARTQIYCVFDMARSGAGLAWDVLVGRPRPPLIDYVEDRDLWRFALPFSREVHAACGSYPLTLEMRATLVMWPIEKLIQEGDAVLRYHRILVADAAKFALRETIGGHDVPSVSLPLLALGSDVGHILCQGEPFAAYWMERPDGSRYYGLRSAEGVGVDVSEIAKQYGGGGHRHAAGFTRRPA